MPSIGLRTPWYSCVKLSAARPLRLDIGHKGTPTMDDVLISRNAVLAVIRACGPRDGHHLEAYQMVEEAVLALASGGPAGDGGFDPSRPFTTLLKRAYEIVRHNDECPAIRGNGDDDCRCDAVPFLRDLEKFAAVTPTVPLTPAGDMAGEDDARLLRRIADTLDRRIGDDFWADLHTIANRISAREGARREPVAWQSLRTVPTDGKPIEARLKSTGAAIKIYANVEWAEAEALRHYDAWRPLALVTSVLPDSWKWRPNAEYAEKYGCDWQYVDSRQKAENFAKKWDGEICPLYAAPPASVDAVAVVTELSRLVQCLIDNDPSDPIADGGHTVLDLWRHEAKAALRAAQQPEVRL